MQKLYALIGFYLFIAAQLGAEVSQPIFNEMFSMHFIDATKAQSINLTISQDIERAAGCQSSISAFLHQINWNHTGREDDWPTEYYFVEASLGLECVPQENKLPPCSTLEKISFTQEVKGGKLVVLFLPSEFEVTFEEAL